MRNLGVGSLDLIATGIRAVRNGREIVEIPSIAFVYKAEQTRATRNLANDGPLPPS